MLSGSKKGFTNPSLEFLNYLQYKNMSEFRTGITSLLKQVHAIKRPLTITEDGKGVAVLLDAGVDEEKQEKIEMLQDIQTSIGQIEADQGVEHEDSRTSFLKLIRK